MIVNPSDKAVLKYELHPGICKIKENTTSSEKFYYREVNTEDVAIQIKKHNSSKASINSIPVRILKENSNVFCALIQNLHNYGLSKCIFPTELKAENIS